MADIAVTQRADIVTASDGYTIKNVGSGVFAAGNAKAVAQKNRQDDLIVQVGRDVYQVTAGQITTKTGAMPAVGESLTLVKDGQELEGVVRYVDQESVERGKRAGRVAAGAAAGGAVVVGGTLLLLKTILDQH